MDTDTALDACCGTGQLTKYLIKEGFKVEGFDIGCDMVEICKLQYPDHIFWEQNYIEPENERKYKLIVSNPPYDIGDLAEFFEYLYNTLHPE
ncbi:MAG: methyltransferase domain-containing protein [Candidatus Peribacteria bacterium]|nr:methyltransferase domain-containing protein [Candidatus Peribacteria bacterium]